MMEKLLEQLTYDPQVRRPLASIPNTLVIGGMGGSALVADALAFLFPDRHIIIHRGYGVPLHTPDDALYIAISYSGNTEETVSFATDAMKRSVSLAIVASGGTLATFADREGVPYSVVPQGLPPRNAFMYMVVALLGLLQESETLSEIRAVTPDLKVLHDRAEQDAHFFLPSVPLFYSSERNACLIKLAKLVMNETARMPAFFNVFSELNHNEMQSFDTDMPEGLEHLFRFMIVTDPGDDPRIKRRIDAFTSLMEERGKLVELVDSEGTRSAMLVTWWLRMIGAGRMLAETRGIDPDTQPLVDAFKKML